MRSTFFQLAAPKDTTSFHRLIHPLAKGLSPLEISQALILALRKLIPHSPSQTGDQRLECILLFLVRNPDKKALLEKNLTQVALDLNITIPQEKTDSLLGDYHYFDNIAPFLVIEISKINHDMSMNIAPPEATQIQLVDSVSPETVNDPNTLSRVIPLPPFKKKITVDELETRVIYALQHHVGNCGELTNAIECYLITQAIPELRDFSCVTASFSNHQLLILYKPKPEINDLSQKYFDSFEDCRHDIKSQTVSAIIIDPWIGHSADISDIDDFMDQVNRQALSHHFEGSVRLGYPKPCYSPDKHQPGSLLSKTYSSAASYEKFITQIKPFIIQAEFQFSLSRYKKIPAVKQGDTRAISPVTEHAKAPNIIHKRHITLSTETLLIS